jgi:hypothetical protein
MRAVVDRIDELVRRFAEASDPEVARGVPQLVRLVMQLYGAGLSRIVRILELQERRVGPVLDALVTDDLIASLLVLHELHPDDTTTRITRALARLGADVGARLSLADLTTNSARVRIEGAPPSSPMPLDHLIDEVVRAAAPEIVRVDVEGLPPARPNEFVQLRRAGVDRKTTPVAIP